MSGRRVVFVVNLVQDVNILRPVIHLAARDLGLPTALLVSDGFARRDTQRVWRGEVAEIARETGSSVQSFASEWDAVRTLQGGGGVLVAGSESTLRGHAVVHDLFRAAPPGFLRVTLQHSFECVGFRHSREHDVVHGPRLGFAADVLCGWQPADRLSHLAPSQHGKLWVTGPTSVLQSHPHDGKAPSGRGLVCENMHSVRLSTAGDFKTDFIRVFDQFSRALVARKRALTLRPHPGGQYFLRNDVPLAANVSVDTAPLYRLDLSRFAFGVSAPSSILIDMALAGVPTAVWRDAGGAMDADAYRDFHAVRDVGDWLAFAERAEADRAEFQVRQAEFFARERLVIDPATVHARFAALLAGATRIGDVLPGKPTVGAVAPLRVMLAAPDLGLPTLRIHFERPLSGAVARGEAVVERMDEAEARRLLGGGADDMEGRLRLAQRIEAFRPDVLAFVRYAGPGGDVMLEAARRAGAGAMMFLDDDLSDVPPFVGAGKSAFHNATDRRRSLSGLLTEVDLVQCSTPRLRDRIAEVSGRADVSCNDIAFAAGIARPARERPVTTIGYMGVGHAEDFARVAPVVAALLRRRPELRFELLGNFPPQPELEVFGARFVRRPPIRDFEAFLDLFAAHEWDIGLCPLEPHPFNLCKTAIKWADYTAIGAAVAASRGTIYDEVCADGCGELAGSTEEWLAAMERLCDPRRRFEQVARAQERLRTLYAPERLAAQTRAMLALAAERGRARYSNT